MGRTLGFRVRLFPQITFEGDPAMVPVLVSDGLRIEPVDHDVLDGICEEVISRWVVVVDEVRF